MLRCKKCKKSPDRCICPDGFESEEGPLDAAYKGTTGGED